jgi:LysR family hydrogen peroxide-inducible transcriptional activator
LRLGVIPTLGPYLLPWLVPPLAEAFPRLKLVLRELKTQDLLAELGDHRLDAGILALPVPARGLSQVELFDEAFFVLARGDHALAARASVAPDDLEGERLLLLEEGHCLRDQALEVCGKRAAQDGVLDLGSDFRATSLETLRHMVAAGMGITLMPALTLEGRAEDGTRAVPFAPERPARRRMALCWRRTHPRARDLELFARFVREHLPAGVTPA